MPAQLRKRLYRCFINRGRYTFLQFFFISILVNARNYFFYYLVSRFMPPLDVFFYNKYLKRFENESKSVPIIFIFHVARASDNPKTHRPFKLIKSPNKRGLNSRPRFHLYLSAGLVPSARHNRTLLLLSRRRPS